ncbi:MAG: RNA polymerase factor sigma-54 [Candidatus Omnitrophica bacterium]|nr:RNA polymerase factor sigma-54 [Candidatus Omnitrophota bacterium]
MALQAKQTAQQRLMAAPNITLALEILRMATLELQAFLEQQLEENPCLELEDSSSSSETESAPEEPGTPPEEAKPTSLDEDWVSHWQTAGEREDPDNEDGADERIIEQRLTLPQSLHESLLLQLGCQPVSKEERALGEHLIHHLDQNGYLEGSLQEMAAELGTGLERLEAVLALIQRLDPPGVGARNLRECLMLQLEQREACGGLAYRILQDHFELFTHHRLEAIAKETGATPQQIAEALECLKRLNPKPGSAYSGELPPSVIPDLVVHHRERHYDVELNEQYVPQVTISRAYHRMLKDPRTPEDAKEFLAQKFRKANWIIKAIDERNTTLLSIARCLISLQREFLEHGSRAIKPLTQAQVAELIGRHPSTVSRAIAGKTIDTPYGIFRLEQLFASGVPQAPAHQANGAAEPGAPAQADAGCAVSNEQIKSEIQRLVADEPPQRCLSDAALAQQLAARHIAVARRTVAKYRTALKILPAHLRKRRL